MHATATATAHVFTFSCIASHTVPGTRGQVHNGILVPDAIYEWYSIALPYSGTRMDLYGPSTVPGII